MLYYVFFQRGGCIYAFKHIKQVLWLPCGGSYSDVPSREPANKEHSWLTVPAAVHLDPQLYLVREHNSYGLFPANTWTWRMERSRAKLLLSSVGLLQWATFVWRLSIGSAEVFSEMHYSLKLLLSNSPPFCFSFHGYQSYTTIETFLFLLPLSLPL